MASCNTKKAPGKAVCWIRFELDVMEVLPHRNTHSPAFIPLCSAQWIWAAPSRWHRLPRAALTYKSLLHESCLTVVCNQVVSVRTGYAAVTKKVSFFSFLPFRKKNFSSKAEELLRRCQGSLATSLGTMGSGVGSGREPSLWSGHLIARERMHVASVPINTS